MSYDVAFTHKLDITRPFHFCGTAWFKDYIQGLQLQALLTHLVWVLRTGLCKATPHVTGFYLHEITACGEIPHTAYANKKVIRNWTW